MTRSVVERFWSKVEPAAADECWEWRASRNDRGYANFWDSTRMVKGHRFAYEHMVADIPEGLTIDHLCRNRACVNPYHMEPVPQSVNSKRTPGALKSAGLKAYHAANPRTHCKWGHEFTEANTYHYDSRRFCRMCTNERGYRAKAKKRVM